MKRGQLFVISGPSGAGKSSVVAQIRQRRPDMYYSVSATTRAMRPTDVDGVTYSFKTRDEFESLIKQNYFFEYAEYAGNYYGTPKTPVDEQLAMGNDVILEIEVQGAMQVKAKSPEAIMIFIVAPSFEVLESRLRGRGDTAEADVQKRLAKSREEYTYGPRYDYIIVNDTLELSTNQVEAVMVAEKLRAERNIEVLRLEESL